MPSRPTSATLAAATALLLLPATAGAGSVTVTGDDGQPLPLAEGTTTQIRQMAPLVATTFDPSEKRYSLQILDPFGKEDPNSSRCVNIEGAEPSRPVVYTGNGTYTLRLTTFAGQDDFYCEQPGQAQTLTFAINAGTRLTPPAPTLLYRNSGFGFKDPVFRYDPNPGANTYRVFYAYDATVGADGGITGRDYREVGAGFPPTGSVAVNFEHAGVVTLIAAAQTLSAQSPPSPHVVVTVVSPFDFGDTPTMSDPKGPIYAISGKVSERLAAGSSLTMALAKGKGKFKRAGTSRIAADGGFKFKFKQRKRGSWRVRYTFAGSRFMTPGVWTEKLTIKARSVSLDSLKHVSGD